MYIPLVLPRRQSSGAKCVTWGGGVGFAEGSVTRRRNRPATEAEHSRLVQHPNDERGCSLLGPPLAIQIQKLARSAEEAHIH